MNNKREYVYIGVDVGKAKLDIYIRTEKGQRECLVNAPRGFARLVAILQKQSKPAWVICEATGGYEKALVRALWAAGIKVTIANAWRVREYARSQGQMAKTDVIDAEVLAEYGRHCKKLLPSLPPTPCEQKLGVLVDRREQVLQMIIAEKNRLHKTQDRQVCSLIRRSIAQLQRQIQQLELAMKELLKQDPVLKKRSECLQQVKGIGWLTSCVLLAKMHELGKIPDKAAAALAGLAPFARDSATFKGKRFIGGGRQQIRNALYMSAISASRYNEHLKPFYNRLIDSGKPPKVALTAVMRKLIVHLNSILEKSELHPC